MFMADLYKERYGTKYLDCDVKQHINLNQSVKNSRRYIEGNLF